MCITLTPLCVWISLSLLTWMVKSLRQSSLLYCCSRNPFTQRCSTVSATRSRVDPSAQNCTICKHISLNLHCRISPLKVQHKKKTKNQKQNTVSESLLMNSALTPEEKQDKSIQSGWDNLELRVGNLSCALLLLEHCNCQSMVLSGILSKINRTLYF